MSYSFDNPAIPSLQVMMSRVAADPALPAGRRGTLLSRLRQLARWIKEADGTLGAPSPSEFPFTEAHIEGLAKRLVPDLCSRARLHVHRGRSVSKKTVDSAISDCRFLLRFYELTERQTWVQLSPEWAALDACIECKYIRMHMKRLLCFLSVSRIRPCQVTADAMPPFIVAVEHDVRVADALLACRRALRAWCKMVKRRPDIWPQVQLKMPRRRVIWGKKWDEMRALERVVEEFFAPPLPGMLFKRKRKKKLAASTIRTQKEAIRCFVSALLNDGVSVEELSDLWSICNPAAFERGIALLEIRAGGVTHWVEKAARVLLKMAKHGNVLTDDEIKKVKELHGEVSGAYADWKEGRPDRDQVLLDKLDDVRLMDALLALPTQTMRKVLASARLTKGKAYAVQRAIILELWFCSALRNVNLLSLRKAHFRRLTINEVEWMLVSVPASETKNGEATEHFLLDDVAKWLVFYLDKCLPLIADGPTDLLFPGKTAPSKHQQTLRVQMKNYVYRGLKLEGFHPHVIRKIVPKIALDEDPTAIEVVRRVGGWKGDKTLRRVYLQKRHRASQARWVELLEARRLRAIGPILNARRPGNAT